MVDATDGIVAGLLFLAVLYFVFLDGLTNSLRERHAKTWATLGEPRFPYSIRNSNRLAAWILFRSDYRSLGDSSLMKRVWLLRAIASLQLVLAAVLLGLRYRFF
jgi:hypothetical protein